MLFEANKTRAAVFLLKNSVLTGVSGALRQKMKNAPHAVRSYLVFRKLRR